MTGEGLPVAASLAGTAWRSVSVAGAAPVAGREPTIRFEADRISGKMEMNREHLLFRVEPRISYVSDDFAEAEPEFWRGKPAESRR